MASGKAYLEFILDQLSGLEEISSRPMMGEYLLYYRGRLLGGIYDDRLLVKITPSSRRLLSGAAPEPPYEGAKPLLPVENVESRPFLEELFNAMAEEAPLPKRRR